MKAMIYQRVLRSAALAMLLLAGTGSWMRAQEKSTSAAANGTAAAPSKSGKAARPDRPLIPSSAKAEDPAAQTQQGLGAFGKVLPVGEKNIDVKIPSFRDGIPSSTVRAYSMTRMDDENMAMERMDIRLYGQTHEKDVRIQLVTALYHMPSQILSSDSRSRVSRDDFNIEGDTMIFDTRTGQGKMIGNVRMVIHDADSLTPQKKTDTPAESGKDTSSSDKTPATDKKDTGAPASTATTPPTSPSSPPANEKK